MLSQRAHASQCSAFKLKPVNEGLRYCKVLYTVLNMSLKRKAFQAIIADFFYVLFFANKVEGERRRVQMGA